MFGILLLYSRHPERIRAAIHQDGKEKEKRPLEEKSAAQERAHTIEREEQSEGESISETRSPYLSESGRQHERGEKAAAQTVEEEKLIEIGLSLKELPRTARVNRSSLRRRRRTQPTPECPQDQNYCDEQNNRPNPKRN